MKYKNKTFNDLTSKELYELLKLRSEVFVVEQNCIYQDLDDIDYNSIHYFIEENGKIVAYLRTFINEEDITQIGRVVTKEHNKGYGRLIMQYMLDNNTSKEMILHAQVYAIGYYEKFGFKVSSEEFLEDNIPHVTMKLERK